MAGRAEVLHRRNKQVWAPGKSDQAGFQTKRSRRHVGRQVASMEFNSEIRSSLIAFSTCK